MCGNCVLIGIIIILVEVKQIQRELHGAKVVWSAVAVGSMVLFILLIEIQ